MTTDAIHAFGLIDLSGNGTRLVVSPDGNSSGFSGFGTDGDDSININFVGFSDNNFNNAELKQVVDAGDFKPVSSGQIFSTNGEKYIPFGSVSMDDTGKLVVFGVEGDQGAGYNQYGRVTQGELYIWLKKMFSQAPTRIQIPLEMMSLLMQQN